MDKVKQLNRHLGFKHAYRDKRKNHLRLKYYLNGVNQKKQIETVCEMLGYKCEFYEYEYFSFANRRMVEYPVGIIRVPYPINPSAYVQELVERDTVVYTRYDSCPKCGSAVIQDYDKFCNQCGQRIGFEQ